jgi:ABC-type glycerol-3-phosphate transport system substrate-binding protein
MTKPRMAAIVASAVTLACAAAAASAGTTHAAGPVTINFWERYCNKPLATAISNFNKTYAGKIKVNDVQVCGSETTIAAKILAAASGGGLPDVAAAGEAFALEYKKAGLLVPLDSLVHSPRLGLSKAQLSDYFPGALARTRLPYGATYSWPMASSALALFYNIDLLKKAGFSHPPTSWPGFEDVANKVKSATGMTGFAFPSGNGNVFLDALWTYGYPWLAVKNGKPNLNNKASVGLLSDWQDMAGRGSLQVTAGNAYVNAFASGQAAMILASSGNVQNIAPLKPNFNWGVTTIPQGAKGSKRPITEAFGSYSVMFKSNPATQQADWTFMKYLAATKNQSAMCPAFGCIPSTRSSFKTHSTVTYIKYDVPQYKTVLTDIAPSAHLPVLTGAYAPVQTVVGNVLIKVLANRESPSNGAADMNAQAGNVIAANRG